MTRLRPHQKYKSQTRSFELLESRWAMAADIALEPADINLQLDSDNASVIAPIESLSSPPASPSSVAWISAGPTSIRDGQSENVPGDLVSGAIQTLITHPTNANIIWVATTNGGIWKTTNATATNPTWVPLTDEFPSLSIGALALDPTVAGNNTIWAGSGRFSSLGQIGGAREGLFKSTNGGTTWTSVTGGGVMLGKNISGIAARGNVIVVSVNVADAFTFGNVGIFRSTNGGASFTQISGGAGTGLAPGLSYDLVSDPLNNNILYTTVFGGSADGIYKSTNRGANWTRVSSPAINSLIGQTTSNMELAVGRHNNVYVGIINQGQLTGLFRSGNGGSSWAQLDTPATNENGQLIGIHPKTKGPGEGAPIEEIAGGQGNIHFSIVADPTNPNIAYVGGDRQPGNNFPSTPNSIGARNFSGRLFRVNAGFTPGGQTIPLTHNPTTNSNSAPHADSRDMAFSADGTLIEVDDGGIYRRTNPRGVGDWFGLHGNLQNTEIHSIAYDSISNVLIAGTQDVGTAVQRINSTVWDDLTQGDGGFVEVDSTTLASQSRSIRYSSFVRLSGFQKTIYNSANQIVSVQNPALNVVGTGKSLAQFDPNLPFYTPIVLNALNPSRALVLSNVIYETSDQFQNLNVLGTGAGENKAFAYGGAGNENVIYVGNVGGMAVRTSATGSFSAMSYSGDEALDMVLDADNWQTGFVIDSDQVFKFTNAGSAFTDVTGNLQSLIGGARIRTISFVPGSGVDGIVVGTDIGTYVSTSNALGTWQLYGASLPNTLVFDLRYNAVDDVLIAGTLGRGAFKVNNASQTLVNQPTPNLIDTVYFTAKTSNGQRELFSTDGSAPGTAIVKNLSGGVSSDPQDLTLVNDTLYFTAKLANGQRELFKSQGTPASTTIVRDLSGGTSSDPQELTKVGNFLYFTALRADGQRELFRTKGTSANTIQVKNIAGSVSADPKELTAIGNKLYFSANINATQRELFVSNGTAAGTKAVRNLYGTLNSDPKNITRVGNRIFFTARIPGGDRELHVSDGTFAGTKITKDLYAATNSVPQQLTAVGNQLYFTALMANGQRELHKSNGTAAGTQLVKNLSGTTSSNPQSLVALGSKLYFSADTGNNKRELFVSNGTTTGTKIVKNLAGAASADPRDLTVVGNRVYFSARTTTGAGRELYRSNGTVAGTVQVKNLNGSSNSGPIQLTAVGNQLVFSAIISNGNRELHISNGTAAGTKLIKNLSGATSALPINFTVGATPGANDTSSQSFAPEELASDVFQSQDINQDGNVTALDALTIISYLNTVDLAEGERTSESAYADLPYELDANGDSMISAADALAVINYMNQSTETLATQVIDGGNEIAIFEVEDGVDAVIQELATDSSVSSDSSDDASNDDLASLDEVVDSLTDELEELTDEMLDQLLVELIEDDAFWI